MAKKTRAIWEWKIVRRALWDALLKLNPKKMMGNPVMFVVEIGSVITTGDLTQVLGIGYNGNARGLPNRCDSAQPGACGCIHSEQNALIKAGAGLPGKVMFVSASPCVMCAKMIINTNVGRVYYREAYRDPAGLDVLRQGGVEVIHYDQWKDSWR